MIYFMEILKFYQEEQLQIKYCVIKHFILLKIHYMMDIEEILLLWFINFLIKSSNTVVLKMKLNKMKS